MKKAIIGLSGGLDSSTLLGYLIESEYEVHVVNFQFGSKQNAYEEKAVEQILEYYSNHGHSIPVHHINLEPAFKDFKSNLLKSGGEIPEGHYEADVMKLTIIPGRNLIFLSIMAGLAESIGAEVIGIGVHSGDHHIYPDCRPDFISAADYTIQTSTEGKVHIITPFLFDDKAGILSRGLNYKIPVPYHLTRTCYKDQEFACAKCGSCDERLAAFKELGIDDPIIYEAE